MEPPAWKTSSRTSTLYSQSKLVLQLLYIQLMYFIVLSWQEMIWYVLLLEVHTERSKYLTFPLNFPILRNVFHFSCGQKRLPWRCCAAFNCGTKAFFYFSQQTFSTCRKESSGLIDGCELFQVWQFQCPTVVPSPSLTCLTGSLKMEQEHFHLLTYTFDLPAMWN